MVYAVDVALLQSIAGSRDEGILDEIKQSGWLQKEIKRTNNYFDDEIQQGAPRREQAIEAIIMGIVPKETRHAFMYAYAYINLCELCSKTFLPNTHWYPISFDFLDKVSEIYKSSGLSRDVVRGLVWNGALIEGLPRPDDFPMLGYVLPKDVREIHAELEQIDSDKLAEGHDEWTQGAIREVQSWYAEAVQLSKQYSTAERKVELGLVGTYH